MSECDIAVAEDTISTLQALEALVFVEAAATTTPPTISDRNSRSISDAKDAHVILHQLQFHSNYMLLLHLPLILCKTLQHRHRKFRIKQPCAGRNSSPGSPSELRGWWLSLHLFRSGGQKHLPLHQPHEEVEERQDCMQSSQVFLTAREPIRQ